MNKEEAWMQHLEHQNQSGLSQAEYCRRHNLNREQFSYWKKKLSVETSESNSFIQVGRSCSQLEVQVGAVLVKLPVGFDQSELKRVLEVLCLQ